MSERFRARSRNAILVKDDVGKAKPTCYDLPSEEFAYGVPDNPDMEGAREVTMQWLSHVPGPRQEERVQDFRKINKLGLKAGVCSAKDLANFRRESAQNVTISGPQQVGPPPKVIPSDVVQGFTYGKKTRPSTPIAAVVSYQFCAEYEQALEENYEQYEYEKRAVGMRRIKTTKAMEGHAARSRVADAVTKEPFKLSKFKKVQAKMKLPDRYAELKAQAAKEGGAGGGGLKHSCSLPAINTNKSGSR